jgi:putative sterol carrier protein
MYAKLRPLIETQSQDLDSTLQRLASLLEKSGKTASLQLTVHGAGQIERRTLNLSRRECSLSKKPAATPDVEIVTSDSVWAAIAGGQISPLEAFVEGRLRVLGDAELATHLLAVAGDGGDSAMCAR